MKVKKRTMWFLLEDGNFVGLYGVSKKREASNGITLHNRTGRRDNDREHKHNTIR